MDMLEKVSLILLVLLSRSASGCQLATVSELATILEKAELSYEQIPNGYHLGIWILPRLMPVETLALLVLSAIIPLSA